MKYFGKLCAIERHPTTVAEFSFWLARGNEDAVEIGYIVTAENTETQQKVFGLVTDIKFFTDAESVLVDYLGHEFGNPRAKLPTDRQEIHLVTAMVIGSHNHGNRPLSSGLVRLSTPDEIHQAYGMDAIENKIFCGVVVNGRSVDNWAPAYMDARFLLGPEGAHLNISGASGLATKTSAAVFLVSSVLSAARRYKRRYAVVAFNVKGGDLLCLDRAGEQQEYKQHELLDLLETSASDEIKTLYHLAKESGVDLTFDQSNLRMYAPAKANDIVAPNSLVTKNVKPFYWSLSDILDDDTPIRFSDLFESDDIDDKAFGVLATIEDKLEDENEWGGGRVTSFRELVHQLTKSQKKGFWGQHHHSTVTKVARLIRTNCQDILNGLLAYDEEKGNDISVEKINPNHLWIIDIEAVNDKAKRLVFHNITTRLVEYMEKQSLLPERERSLHGVIVFVDELNKFAPTSGGRSSRIKQQIIELAARGRSLGVILFGAEQFASRVDKEVTGNASSHLLGRTEELELSDKAYGWLSKDLRFVVSGLEKGKLLLKHATYGRPVFVRFPQPLYNIADTMIDDMLETKQQPKSDSREKASERDVFSNLQSVLKGHSGIHPIKIYDEVASIRELGISQNAFANWYRAWTGQKKYKGRSSSERKAIEMVISHYSSKSP